MLSVSRPSRCGYENIRTALDLQATQRRHGVPVLPLRVICGLEKPQHRNDRVILETTHALLMVPQGNAEDLRLVNGELFDLIATPAGGGDDVAALAGLRR